MNLEGIWSWTSPIQKQRLGKAIISQLLLKSVSGERGLQNTVSPVGNNRASKAYTQCCWCSRENACFLPKGQQCKMDQRPSTYQRLSAREGEPSKASCKAESPGPASTAVKTQPANFIIKATNQVKVETFWKWTSFPFSTATLPGS